jgi:hypothetical protein
VKAPARPPLAKKPSATVANRKTEDMIYVLVLDLEFEIGMSSAEKYVWVSLVLKGVCSERKRGKRSE